MSFNLNSVENVLAPVASVVVPIADGISNGATAAVHAVGGTVATAAAQHTIVSGTAAFGSTTTQDLQLAKQPIAAAANGLGATRAASFFERTAGFLGKVLPPIVIGTSALQGAEALENGGPSALIHTQQGRSAVLGAVGGTLLLIPTPVTQLGGAMVLAGSMVNSLGGLKALDGTQPTAT